METQSHSSFSSPSSAELLLLTGSASFRPLSSLSATSHISRITQGRYSERKDGRAQSGGYRPATTIGTLPDNVLLEIFDSYRSPSHIYQELYQDNIVPYRAVWEWHLLVHVCRRWRQIVFESPHRLNLEILCTHRTSTRKNLSIWPAFPIIIVYRPPGRSKRPLGQGNIIAALKHADRVCYLSLYVTGSQLGKMATAMRKLFPVLTRVHVISNDRNVPVLPAKFLGGSAPRLQELILSGIPYPALPSLLLSTSDLVNLELRNIPPNGYISPEAMVASLAVLPRLESLYIGLRPATSRPDRMHPPPISRTVLPALTTFSFKGASEYLEDLVSRIDGPQLDRIFTVYLNQLVDFQVAQLSRFIDRSVGPKLNLSKHAHVEFYGTEVTFVRNHASPHHLPTLNSVVCEGIDWQVSHMAHILSQFSAALSNVVHLKLTAELKKGRQLEGTDDVEWLHLLRQFSTVQTLHVSSKLAGRVSLALEDITAEMVTELLPSLDLICVEGQPASSIEKFISARRLSGRPVTIVNTETEFNRRLESYVSK